ncbi:MAG: hypothetical protein AAF518_26210 [Spirochaetota bacterium]
MILLFVASVANYLFIYKYIMSLGVEKILLLNSGRDSTGYVSLHTFLTYGGSIGYEKFLGLFSGYDVNIDNSMYLGYITSFFLIVKLFFTIRNIFNKNYRKERVTLFFLTFLIVLISLSTGGLIASIAYHTWPTMKLYRHIGLISSFIKFVLIFFSALGVQEIIRWYIKPDVKKQKIFYIAIALTFIIKMVSDYTIMTMLVMGKKFNLQLSSGVNYNLMKAFFNDYFFFYIPLTISIILFYTIHKLYKYRNANVVMSFVLFLMILADITLFRVKYDNAIMPGMSKQVFDTLEFFKYTYQEKRKNDYLRNNRFKAFLHLAKKHSKNVYYIPYFFKKRDGTLELNSETMSSYGAVYWHSESFYYHDALSTINRSDHLLNNINDYYDSNRNDQSKRNRSVESRMNFRKAFLKIIGNTENKIQFFKKIYFVKDKQRIQSYLKSDAYQGDIIFTNTKYKIPTVEEIPFMRKEEFLQSNDRINLSHKVTHFNFNKIVIEVYNNSENPVIMHYADGNHPFWKVKINSKNDVIMKSNIGFKAVNIPKGRVEVVFYYQHKYLDIAREIFKFYAWIGIFIIIAKGYSILNYKEGSKNTSINIY